MELKKVQRQVQIMVLLSECSKGMTVPSLHKALQRIGFDMDIRTIRRDLDDLVPVFNIKTDGNENAYTYQLSGIHLGSLSFRFEDMQAFQLLNELAKPYYHLDIGLRMKRFLEQLKSSIPPIQREWLQNAATILSVNPVHLQEDRDIPVEIRHMLEEGLSMHHVVHLQYFSFSNNTVSERDVEPLRIEFSEGCLHLWAYCRAKQGIRDFRISRIGQVKMTEDIFEPQLDLLKNALENRFGLMSRPDAEKVVIRFKGFSARFVMEYHRAQSDKIEPVMDGSILFERTTGITDDFIRWILGFGADAEVLEPVSLRERIRKTAYGMLGMYVG